MLTSCDTYKIVNDYDDFDQKRVCKLDSFEIASDLSLFSSRKTFITLVRKNFETIDVKLSIEVINNYESLSNNGRILFKLVEPDDTITRLTFTGHNHKKTVETKIDPHHNNLSRNIKKSFVEFSMSVEELEKIVNAKKVIFVIEANDEPVKGDLDNDTRQTFKTFLKECFGKKH